MNEKMSFEVGVRFTLSQGSCVILCKKAILHAKKTNLIRFTISLYMAEKIIQRSCVIMCKKAMVGHILFEID